MTDSTAIQRGSTRSGGLFRSASEGDVETSAMQGSILHTSIEEKNTKGSNETSTGAPTLDSAEVGRIEEVRNEGNNPNSRRMSKIPLLVSGTTPKPVSTLSLEFVNAEKHVLTDPYRTSAKGKDIEKEALKAELLDLRAQLHRMQFESAKREETPAAHRKHSSQSDELKQAASPGLVGDSNVHTAKGNSKSNDIALDSAFVSKELMSVVKAQQDMMQQMLLTTTTNKRNTNIKLYNMKISKFKGVANEDGTEWLEWFESMCEAYDIAAEDRATALPSYFENMALTWYFTLTEEVKINWDKLKEQFNEQFASLTITDLYNQLESIKQFLNERIQEYALRLERVWIRLSTLTHVSEEQKVHKFIVSLNNEAMKLRLQEYNEVDLSGAATYTQIKERALKLAKLYPMTTSKAPAAKKVVNVIQSEVISESDGTSDLMPILVSKSSGQQVDLSPQTLQELRALLQVTGNYGNSHTQRYRSPAMNPQSNKTVSSLKCGYCGKPGHTAKQCYTQAEDKKSGRDRRVCYHCNARAVHTAFDCPTKAKRPTNPQADLPAPLKQQSEKQLSNLGNSKSVALVNQTTVETVVNEIVSASEGTVVSLSGTQLPMSVEATIGNQLIHAVIDTGACVSCIDKTVFQQLEHKYKAEADTSEFTCGKLKLRVANGEVVNPQGLVKLPVLFGKKVSNNYTVGFWIVDGLSVPLLLGCDAQCSIIKRIDFQTNTIELYASEEDQRLNGMKDNLIIPFKIGHTHHRNSNQPEAGLHLLQETVFPAQSQTVVYTQCIPDSEWTEIDTPVLVEQAPHIALGLNVVASVTQCKSLEQLIPVVISNTTDVDCSLPCNIKVARVYDVALVQKSEAGPSNEVTSVETGEWSQEEFFEYISIDSQLQRLTVAQQIAVKSLLWNRRKVVAKTMEQLGKTNLVQHHINTGDHPPIRLKSYKLSEYEWAAVNEQVEEMLKAGLVRHSNSPWSFPIVVVKKKNGQLRMCLDFRKLNRLQTLDGYRIPNANHVFMKLNGKRFFTALDLQSGYHQVEISEEDKCKTAFWTPKGLFEYNRMPFGVMNAPGCFQRLMDVVFAPLPNNIAISFLDDTLIPSVSFEQHLVDVDRVLKCIEDAGLTINAKKSSWFQEGVEFLGHKVDANGVSPTQEKVQAFISKPSPRNLKELQSVLGAFNYYSRFIKDYSVKVAPLLRLTRKNVKFEWSNECEEAFARLKQDLCSAPVLKCPQYDKPYIIHTDASDDGLGVVLSQLYDDGFEHPIAYASHIFSDRERKWHSTEKEAAAIAYAFDKFREYIHGHQITLVTDNWVCHYLMTSEKLSPKLARIALKIQEFNPTIKHRSGTLNANADALSRAPLVNSTMLTLSDLCEVNADPEMNVTPEVHVFVMTRSAAMEQRRKQDDTKSQQPTSEKVAKELSLTHLNEFVRAQKEDSFCKELMEFLQHGELPMDQTSAQQLQSRARHYKLGVQGQLLRQDTTQNYQGRFLLVVPFSLKLRVMQACHSDLLAGHFGNTKTYERVSRSYYWPTCRGDVKHFVQQCDQCEKDKDPRSSNLPIMGMRPVTEPMSDVSIDLCGPFPETREGYKYICVISDLFSRWREISPIKDGSSESVATVLFNRLICQHGAPLRILSDQGKCFLSEVWLQVCKLCSIKPRTTSPYHPQSNGVTERINAVIVAALRKYIDSTPHSWSNILPAIQFAINTTVNRSTGYTPYFLLYGVEARNPYDAILTPRDPKCESLTEYAYRLIVRLAQAHEVTRQNMQTIVNQHSLDNEKKKTPLSFQIGDKVRYWTALPQDTDQSARKLLMHWQGPHTVVEVIGPVNYRIESRVMNSKGKEVVSQRVVHIRRLKPYTGSAASMYEHDLNQKAIETEYRAQAATMDDESNRISTTEQLQADSSSSIEESQALPNPTTTLSEWQPSPNFQLWEEGHDDICFRCGKMGRRYLCSKCPKSYHLKCLQALLVPERKLTVSQVNRMKGWCCKDFGLFCDGLRDPIVAQAHHQVLRGRLTMRQGLQDDE